MGHTLTLLILQSWQSVKLSMACFALPWQSDFCRTEASYKEHAFVSYSSSQFPPFRRPHLPRRFGVSKSVLHGITFEPKDTVAMAESALCLSAEDVAS